MCCNVVGISHHRTLSPMVWPMRKGVCGLVLRAWQAFDSVIVILQDTQGVHLADCQVGLRQNMPQGGLVCVDRKWEGRTMEVTFPVENHVPDSEQFMVVRWVTCS
jgi:hypothetical protein